MKGFFTKQQIIGAPACDKCGRHRYCNTPKLGVKGNGKKGILVVGEVPGREDDLSNKHLSGASGNLFRSFTSAYGLDIDRDCWTTTALQCYPQNGDATPTEFTHCKPLLDAAIRDLKPRQVWLLGTEAIKSFYRGRKLEESSATLMRGRVIPDLTVNAFIIPMLSPVYMLIKNDDGGMCRGVAMRDIKYALSSLELALPQKIDYAKRITLLQQTDDIVALLKAMTDRGAPTSFDYETTGIKPYNPGHQIACIGVSDDPEKGYGFPYQYRGHFSQDEQRTVKAAWRKFIGGANPKIAHNMKFEDMWSRVIIGVQPQNWHWCTQVNQHLLDERQKSKGLKFQAFVRWAVEDYDSDIKKYIKSEGAEEFNKVHEAPLRKLLTYNGLDALFTTKLYYEQRDEFRMHSAKPIGPRRAIPMFHEGTLALSDAQITGINVSKAGYDSTARELKQEIDQLYRDLMGFREVAKFRERKGVAPNFDSSPDIRFLLFDVMKLDPKKKTNTGLDAADKDTLEEYDHPLCKTLMRWKKLNKILDFVELYVRETSHDGRMHPFFDLDKARTGRSSSSSPNYQNVPKRDDEAKAATRGSIMPSPGNRFGEVDYGAVEVRIAACYTRDPALVAYIYDESRDMHRDQAMELYLLPEPEVSKKVRNVAKNAWVFPQFYGAWWKSCASNLWLDTLELQTESGTLIHEHLYDALREKMRELFDSERDPFVRKEIYRAMKQGDVQDWFFMHVKAHERAFWQRFPVFKEWQEKTIADYIQFGYIENFFGFRRRGLLSRNELLNTNIQGTAFQCLLWSFIRINQTSKTEQWQTKTIGQIHDSIVLDVKPEEANHVIWTCNDIMTRQLREEHEWVIVPMIVEPELGEIDGSWITIKGVEIPQAA